MTLNRKYAAAFLGFGQNPAYTKTIFNEITLLPRESVIEIDIKTKELTLKYIRVTQDLSMALDSSEGIQLLNTWQQKWVSIYRMIKDQSDNITIQLTGGFDSRLNFALVLCSKINLNDIIVESHTNAKHTHKEDYEIASEIASCFGFTLNKPVVEKCRHFKLKQYLDTQLFKIFEHNQMYFRHLWHDKVHFEFPGYGGETLRNY